MGSRQKMPVATNIVQAREVIKNPYQRRQSIGMPVEMKSESTSMNPISTNYTQLSIKSSKQRQKIREKTEELNK